MLWTEISYEMYCELEDAFFYDEEHDTETLEEMINRFGIIRESIPEYAFDFDT